MLQEKSLADPKIRNIAVVAANLIVCIAFFMFGGVSQMVGGPLTVKGFLKRSTGETLEPTKVEFLKNGLSGKVLIE